MTLNQSELSEKLKVLKSISVAKLNEEAQGVLLKDKMLIANNFKTSIVVPLADCEETESYIIPPKAIDFIIGLPEGNVEIVNEDKQLTVKCGKIKSKFSTYDTELFPETNTNPPDEAKLLVNAKSVDLEKTVKQVMFACSKSNPSKPVHEGLMFESDGQVLNIVACDGYRMAWQKISNSNEFKIVLDKEALQKAFAIAEEDISIYENDKKSIIIKAGDYEICSKLYEAEKFVQYEKVYPKTHKISFKVNRNEILNCFNRLSLCISEKRKYPAVLEFNSETLNISTADEKVNINETLSLTEINGNEEIKIGANIDYMKEALKAASSDEVTFRMNSAGEAIAITDDSLKQIILPVRLKG